MRRSIGHSVSIAAASAAVVAVVCAASPVCAESFDARWLALDAAPKQDRLAPPRREADAQTFTFTDAGAKTTIVQKAEILPIRPTRYSPVRELPKEENVDKEKLPVACEPSFSPVAAPNMAHITGRCFAARIDGRKVAELTR